MQFTLQKYQVGKAAECVVLGVVDHKLSSLGKALDKSLNRRLSHVLAQGDLTDNLISTQLVHCPQDACKRVLLVSLGTAKALTDAKAIKVMKAAAAALKKLNLKTAVWALQENLPSTEQSILQAILKISDQDYQYTTTKKAPKTKQAKLSKVIFHVEKNTKALNQILSQGKATAAGMAVTKQLGNLPANICTPTHVAKQAQAMAKGDAKLQCKVLSEAEMKKLKMNTLLSVSAGSSEPAKLVCLDYKGGKKGDKPIVLVGKGVTFDSGGISLKPGNAMDEMKYDMCGAATVMGVFKAITTLKLKLNVVGIMPCTENMPGSKATKPGDVITSMSGQTVEVLNTDAEGRLILSDALTYAGRFKPKAVIDIATLTGAMVVALGHHTTGIMGNDDKLVQQLVAAGANVQDLAWQLPMGDHYDEMIKTNFADMANIGSGGAGSITAAQFLGRFTKDYQWAHMDIAGTAWVGGGESKGATGRPVPLLTQYLVKQAG